MFASAIFGHQGGWDEILFVLAPLVVFAGLLLGARRRVDRLETDGDATERPADEPRASDPA